MTRETAITDAYMYATGKSVAIGSIPSAKRNLLTSLAIKFNRDWQTENGIEWDSLYSVVSAGTVTATNQFTLATPINFVSTDKQRENNKVRVLCADGVTYVEFMSVKPSELYSNRYRNAVAHVASSGVDSVKFSRAFTTSDQAYGGTIQVPAITKLGDLTTDASTVYIDNPEWLPWRMAAQYAYSYKSLRDMYPDLLDKANELMTGMIGRNISGNESTSTGVDYFATMGSVGLDC